MGFGAFSKTLYLNIAAISGTDFVPIPVISVTASLVEISTNKSKKSNDGYFENIVFLFLFVNGLIVHQLVS